jgi:hypothetical protein
VGKAAHAGTFPDCVRFSQKLLVNFCEFAYNMNYASGKHIGSFRDGGFGVADEQSAAVH